MRTRAEAGPHAGPGPRQRVAPSGLLLFARAGRDAGRAPFREAERESVGRQGFPAAGENRLFGPLAQIIKGGPPELHIMKQMPTRFCGGGCR